MTPTESLLKELEEADQKTLRAPLSVSTDFSKWDGYVFYKLCWGEQKPYPAIGGFLLEGDATGLVKMRNALPALLQIIRTQREELERMAKVDVSLLSNELAAAWALRHWVFARDALSRCDEIAKGVGK